MAIIWRSIATVFFFAFCISQSGILSSVAILNDGQNDGATFSGRDRSIVDDLRVRICRFRWAYNNAGMAHDGRILLSATNNCI